jgi:thiol:disulfide interchange protein DsbA
MMNCETIDAILDDHRLGRLEPTEQAAVNAHLAGCNACAAAWSADRTLRAESMGEPPPRLLAQVLRRVSEPRAQPRAAARAGWWSLAAAAVVTAAVVAAGRWYPASSKGGAAPPQAAAPAVSAPRSAVALAGFVAGIDYEVLTAPPLGADADGRIPVTEFFMFLCFPCYDFEAELAAWYADASSRVALTRVPSLFYPGAELHARAFYTAAALGKLDAMHAAFYEEIHVRGNRLESDDALAALFARFGVDGATFARVFNSPEVDDDVRRAVELNRRFAITATPTMVVAGRYSTRRLAVVDALVAAVAEGSAPSAGAAAGPIF